MKTTPRDHQTVGLDLLKLNLDCFMLACEQGTGKTWMGLADAEYQLSIGHAEALLVIAPKGVHTNWVLREIPTHLSVPVRSAYFSAGASRKRKDEIERLFRPRQPGELIVLAMNIDAINFKEGYSLACRFLKHYASIMVIDESSRIKTPTSARTKKAIKLGNLAVSRRALSGTPITNTPGDIYTQFEFMAPGRALLGTSSYRAFVAEYAEVLPDSHPFLKAIRERKEAIARSQGRVAQPQEYSAQLIKKDTLGRPIWRNLDKLNRILKPKMYRILKADCLDLPPKIYKTLYYELAPAQQKIYDQVKEELRLEVGDEIDIYSPLTLQTKLQQIASGFILRDGIVNTISEIANGIEDTTSAILMLPDENPRLEVLRTAIEDIETPFIVWARYRQEITQIAKMLAEMGIEFVEYHGAIKRDQREIAIDRFQSGEARCFLSNPQSGGIGLTLTKAENVFYYSQSYNAEIRWQSEDRCHRIGTVKNVVYTDLAAIGTIDEKISAALQHKTEMAHSILDKEPYDAHRIAF